MTQTFSQRLKDLREKNGFGQSRVAGLANVSKAAISAYENGLRQPSYDILIRLAAIFGVSTDYLLGVTNERVLDISGLTENDIAVVRSVTEALRKKNGLLSDQASKQ